MMSKHQLLLFSLCIGLTLLVSSTTQLVQCQEAEKLAAIPDEAVDVKSTEEKSAKTKSYTSPKIKQDGLYLYENFDDAQRFQQKWISSKDPKYTGEWQLNSGEDRPQGDKQLLLPNKARHYAISSKLSDPFKFNKDKPLIVQYEVQFREGLDCGGAYVKLLRKSAIDDLKTLTDKTPYSIMFGPDKCGSDAKLHFIIQYPNPKTQEFEEKHWKQAKHVSSLLGSFSDKKHHLFRLILEPSNNFEIFLDDKSVGKGSLLEDLNPAINPAKEIVDPNDTKPEDWDERPQIEDPDARKPEDWDDDASRTIEDPNAKKPGDWLEDEPKYIPDPEAKKPEDWEDMDGEWEAPLIDNPACVKVSGCGEWKAPTIANPNYKGKWKPAKIDNPNYKGKWTPRMIPNPDYYFDESPFSSLDSIGAISFELWSMSDNIGFDNLIITNNLESANLVQILSWQDKKAEADASSPSLMTRSMHYLNIHPWLWAIVVIVVALPLFLFISYCCETKKSSDSATESARRKKTDEPKPDEHATKDDDDDEVLESSGETAEGEERDQDQEDDQDEDEEEDEDADEDEVSGDKNPSKRSVRQRKK